jgi:hypothetical protein
MTRIRAFLSDEGGTASIEFLFVVPIVMLIFIASIESSYFMIRHVMLERSVDIVVRDIRLGTLDYLKDQKDANGDTVNAEFRHNVLKELICSTSILSSKEACVSAMKIWLQPINVANFDMVAPPRDCMDQDADISVDQTQSDAKFKLGSDNEIMLVRVCLKEKPMFPTSIVGAGLIADGEGDGGYALITTSIFVNEPG